MRKIASALLLAAFATTAMGSQQGQPPRQPHSQQQMEQHARQRAREMRERLQLDEKQEDQMRPILRDAGKRTREIFERYRSQERSQETMQSMREELDTIRAKTRTKLEPILTPEQLVQFDELQEEWRKARQKSKRKGR